MSTTQRAGIRTAAAFFTVLTACAIAFGASPSPASAAPAGEVVAADTSTVVAASAPQAVAISGPRAIASAPRAISVIGHGGKPVSLSAKGKPAKRIPRPGRAPATFTGLTAGVAYQVRVGGKSIGTVTALDRPTDATNLSVRTTDQPTAVSLTWLHRPTQTTGGRNVQYLVSATSPTAATVSARVASTLTANLPGLDPSAIYTFTVTPINTAGPGKATKATMTRSLASITGATDSTKTPTPVAADTTPAPKATTQGAPAPAPASSSNSNSAPAAPPAPRTTTIYVCPDGYATNGDTCQQTRAYTFHIESVAYTYHWGVVGSHIVHHNSTDPCNYLPNPNSPTGLDIYCPPGWDETVYDYGNIKDATPSGYTDNGTTWEHQVKDTPPTGFTDDGTQYVKTVSKVAQTITV